MDLEPLQQGTHHPLRVEGRPGRQQAGKEEAQEEKIQHLPPAGRGGEPAQHRVYQIQAEQRVEDPQVEIDIPQGGGPQGTQDAGPAHRPAAQQMTSTCRAPAETASPWPSRARSSRMAAKTVKVRKKQDQPAFRSPRAIYFFSGTISIQ